LPELRDRDTRLYPV